MDEAATLVKLVITSSCLTPTSLALAVSLPLAGQDYNTPVVVFPANDARLVAPLVDAVSGSSGVLFSLGTPPFTTGM